MQSAREYVAASIARVRMLATGSGVRSAVRAYTMPDGVAKATAYIDLSDKSLKEVRIAVTNRGRTLTATTTYQAT